MLELWKFLFLGAALIPETHCYLPKPELLGVPTISQVLLTLADYSIALTLLYFFHKRKDLLPLGSVLLFSAVMLAGGSTHLIEILRLWYPLDWVSAGFSSMTALLALWSVKELLCLLPKVLAIANPTATEISDRQSTENNEQQLATILDTIGACIFIKDLNNTYTYVNSLAAELFGYSQAEIIGSDDFKFFSLEMAELVRKNDQQVIQTGKRVCTHDFGFVKKCGELRHYLAIKMPLKTSDGRVYAICGIATDITELKRTEEALRQSEERYRAIVEAQTEFICRFQADTTILFVNQAFCRYFGQSKTQLMGQSYTSLIFTEDQHKFTQFLQTMTPEDPVKILEYRVVIAEEIRWMQWENRMLLDESGSLIEFQSIGRDITEQKHAEDALRESEERWQLALRGNNDGIWDWNVKTNQVFFSARWKAMLGYEEDEIANHLDEWSQRVHPDDRDKVIAIIQDHLEQKIPFYLSEHRILCKDGTYKWILDRGQALWDSQGNVIRMTGSHTDITDRKRAEEELQWKETLLRSMADASPLAFYVVDNHTDNILYFNHRFCEIWGIEHLESQMQQGELKNNDIIPNCAALITDLPTFIESCKPLQSEENRAVIEDEIPLVDGRIIRRFSTQIRSESDRYFGRLYLFEDITKRKEIEAELKLSAFSIECSSLPTVWIDRNGRILRANEAACQQLGYSCEALLSLPIWDFNPSFYREAWLEHWQQVKTQKTLSLISEHRTKDGRILPVEVTFNYLEFNGQEYNFACARDISDRLQSEEHLRRYERIFSATNDGMCLVDRNYTYQLVNQAYLNFHQKEYHEVIGHKVSEVVGAEIFANQIKISQERCFSGETIQYEMWLSHPEGKRQFISVTYAPFYEMNGNISGVVVSLRDLTELKKVQQQLELQDTIVKNMAEGICLVRSSDGVIVYANPKFEQMFGYKFREINGQHISTLNYQNSGNDAISIYEKLTQKFNTHDEYSYEIHTIKKDGTPFWCWATTSRLEHPEHGMIYVTVQEDITERKQTEAALKESEERFRRAFDDAAIGMALVSPDRRWLKVNRALCEIVGYTPAELLSLGVQDITHPDDWMADADYAHQLVSGEIDTYKIEKRYLHQQGNIIWIHLSGSIVRDEQNHPLYVIAQIEDITARKRMELELRAVSDRFQYLLTTSPAVIFSRQAEVDYGTTFISQNVKAILGYEIEEFLTHPNFWQTKIHPQDLPKVLAGISKVSSQDYYAHEYRFQHADGGYRWIYEQIRYIQDATGQPREIVGYFVDISDRKQAETALQDSEQRFRAIFNQTFQFTGLLQPNGVVLELNQSALDFSGLKRFQVVGKFIWNIRWWKISKATQNQLKAAIARAAQGEFMRYEVEILGKGDRLATIDFSVRPILDESGFVKLLILEGRDITKRKQMEAALRDSQQMLSTILDNAGSCIFIKDLNGCYTYVNRATVKLLGYLKEEIIGANDGKFFAPDIVQEFRTNDWQVIKTGKIIKFQEQVVLKHSGEVRHYWAVKVPLKRADGSVYGICCISTDITELKQTEAALRQSESTLRSFFNSKSMAMGIIELHDNDVLHLSDNLTSAQFFGTTPEAMQNRFSTDLGTPRLHLDLWLQHYREALETQAPVQFEYAHQTPKGERWLSASVCPIATASGSLPRLSYIVEDISDRKRVEQAFKESQERLQLALEGSGDGLWDWNITTGEIYLSSRYQEMLGYQPGELNLDVNLWETMIHPEDQPSAKAILKDHLKDTSIPYTYEYRLRTKLGEWKWFSNYGKVVIRNVDGSPLRMTGTHRDVNDRKLIEEALRQSQYFLQKVANAAPYILYLFDLIKQSSTYLNQQSINILGYSPAEICGADSEWVRDHFHPDDQYLCSNLHNRFINLSDQDVLSTEYRFRHKNGEWRWLNTREVVFSRDANGIPIQTLGAIEDISDRKHAELALRQNEAMLKHVTASIPGIIYSFGYYPDGSAGFEYMSQGSVELFELEPQQILENPALCLYQVHPEDLEQREATVAHAVENLQGFNAEWRNIAPSGKQRWVRAQAQPEVREDGSRVWHGVVLDISDLKATEIALQQALSAAQAASIAKSRFLSNMSHELRTPLNAILGFSQVMARSSTLSEEQKEQLKIINRSGEHLLNLINDILSVSKIESGQITLNPAPFDLYQLLKDLEKMLELKAASKGIQLSFEQVTEIPRYVVTDENKLRQVLINLLGNAIKFTQQGRVTLSIQVGEKPEFWQKLPETANPEFSLEFAIEDTGPGIAPDEIQTLFNPFVQTETGRQSMQGTGLGLTISREFVRLMGGEIRVSSQVGQGTTFSFNIVLSEANEIYEKAIPITKRVIGLEPNQSSYRILVAEDVAENRQLLVKLLAPLGFQVREAINGQEAIALWSTWKPHLIWMDMRMPVMDGYEATQQIKAQEKQHFPERKGLQMIRDRLQRQQLNQYNRKTNSDLSATRSLPKHSSENLADQVPIGKTVIIALTASAFDEERNRILSVGCDDFVHKPFQESVLFEKMAKHLGVRYLYEEEDQPPLSPAPEPPKQLQSEDLTVMPSEWILQLHHAVLCADDQLIFTLIEQVPETESALAEILTDLVNNYRLDLLFNLTQEFVSQMSPPSS